ncbi:hypothetical protein SCLARK_0057 [Spiroplasma clarkii]|uniref:Uncharacterized protein n=1 Tax=Spiroplasma clarkii TaxID=2139 RepID=A0A1Y0KYT4_9MOLU|nr:hypothetical protein [Spiroplasma clarkii]ARU90881.1 hypothetical protein SCLARK_0057 [Spiroplasma clarkii]ATX71670.1 hypothetical protein SCLAR_v1c13720 [Spiroplasma clarkii]
MADYDMKCFKCIEEMQKDNKGGAVNILKMKMQQSVANQDLDSIYVCAKHS